MSEVIQITLPAETIVVQPQTAEVPVTIIEETVAIRFNEGGLQGQPGPPGALGAAGADGADGQDGADGASIYPFDGLVFFDGQNQINAIPFEVKMLVSGYVIGITVDMDDQRTAGSILFKPAKNGTAIAASNLDCSINGSYPLDNYVNHDADDPNFAFAAGDKLGLAVVSTNFAPLANTARFSLIFKAS